MAWEIENRAAYGDWFDSLFRQISDRYFNRYNDRGGAGLLTQRGK